MALRPIFLRCLPIPALAITLVVASSSPLLAQQGGVVSGVQPESAAEPTTGDDAWEEQDEWAEETEPAVEFHGFVELALGTRLSEDQANGFDDTLQELRFRAELEHAWGPVEASFAADLLADRVDQDDLSAELREGNLSFTVGAADFRVGRQVLTWGTGDLLFLNDLFPKDWVSFFAGREISYLKRPSDSLKASLYRPALNLDLVWTPIFAPDRFLTGERFTFYSPLRGAIVGAPPKIDPIDPVRTVDNGELALRLYRTFGSKELAFYAYRGFFKQPTGFDPRIGRPLFPELSVWGASLRGPSWGGIGNVEVAWHESRQDRSGVDPLTPNSQYRLLLGHERELVRRLTLGLQYYVEAIADHSRLLANLPLERRATAPDQLRHVVTTRWSYRIRQDRLIWSLFVFYSPSDRDWFAIPSVSYRISDHWRWDAGLNLFGGAMEYTFFGQFQDNSNLFTRVRRSF